MTSWPGAHAHRRVPGPGRPRTQSGPRTGIARARGCAARGPTARASPDRSSAAPPSPVAAPRRGPSAATTKHSRGRRVSPSRGPSPPSACAYVPGSGAQAARPQKKPAPGPAPPRPIPRSALRALASPADVRRRAPLPTRAPGGCLPARPAHAPAYGTPGLRAPPARRCGPSGFGASPEPLLPVVAVLPDTAPCHYEEIEPGFTCPPCSDCLKPKGCWSSAWRAQLHKRFRTF